MSDLISRQAAIEAVKDWYDGLICGSFKGLKKRLEALPSAQPEIIRCKDCKHWQCDDSESYCDELGIFNTDMNSYCSYAKRREE